VSEKNALIGYTGFVGSNLMNQIRFDHLYNTSNISEICNIQYDTVYCAAPTAVKWYANKHPIQDLDAITKLLISLENLKTKRFVLFSTVDVYGDRIQDGLDENYQGSLSVHPYGRNRLILETYIRSHFESHILRLPALFGQNLKKNIIFDLLNNNMVNNISLSSKFQWYYLNNLKATIDFVINNNIPMLNCVSEPIQTYEIVKRFFPNLLNNCNGESVIKYDIKTKYFDNSYLNSTNDIIKDFEDFFK